jgi:N-dimethylarginine dimethylaminohydrolase
MTLPTLLMCPPAHYDVKYVINPWMVGNIHRASKQRACEQWKALQVELEKHAEVLLVTPHPDSPDMVFTANAGLAHGRSVALSHFQYAERQGEEEIFRHWFQTHAYDVFEMPRGMSFEGEGDALFAVAGDRLWVGFGYRTSQESHDALRKLWQLEVVSLRLVDPRFYHLDTCFSPLPNGDVMYFPAAFDEVSQRAIEAYYPPERRVVVAEADALHFACNVVCLGKTLVLNLVSISLVDELERRGFTVRQIDLSEFLKAGGAAKCLVMTLG